MEPLVKVTLTVYVPAEVFLPAATLKIRVAVPAGDKVRLPVLRVTEGPCGPVGAIDVNTVTGPVKPPRLVSVTVETAIDEFV